MKAMQDELARSMQKLQLETLEKPYFIAYRVREGTGARVAASFGSLLGSSEGRSRTLTVEVRVGSPMLDNTNFLSFPSRPSGVIRTFGGTTVLPLDDNYHELRRTLWLATDAVYKQALEDLSKKKAALQNKTRTDEIPDFSKETPAKITETAPLVTYRLEEIEAQLRDISALFKEMPDVFTCQVQWFASNSLTRYVNSEGTSYVRHSPSVSLNVLAATQAKDGMPIEDFAAYYGRQPGELPSKEQLATQIRQMGQTFAQLRQAPLIETYNGPVLFEGQAAAELFSQAFAPRLLATRKPIAESPQLESLAAQAENPFLDMLGARVLPESFNVVDDPSRSDFEGQRTNGGYKVDDEGVPARNNLLVENGMLKALLSNRNPVRGIQQSSGNDRGAGPLPSNLLVTVRNGVAAAALKEQLLKLVRQRNKEYGVVVRRIGNPSLRASRDVVSMNPTAGRDGTRLEPVILAVKVFPDGREELIRNAELSGISPATFKEILGASLEPTVYSTPFRNPAPRTAFSAGGSSSGIISIAIPSLLFEEITLKKPVGEIPNPPVASHPYFDR